MNHCGCASALVNLTMLIYDSWAMVKSTNQPNSWQMNELFFLYKNLFFDDTIHIMYKMISSIQTIFKFDQSVQSLILMLVYVPWQLVQVWHAKHWLINELNTLNSYVVWSLWIRSCSGFFSFHLFLVFVLRSSILFLLHILHTEQSLPPVLQVLRYYIVLVQYNIVQWNPWDYLKTQINVSIKNLSLLAFLVSCHFHPPNSGVIKKLDQTAITQTPIQWKQVVLADLQSQYSTKINMIRYTTCTATEIQPHWIESFC